MKTNTKRLIAPLVFGGVLVSIFALVAYLRLANAKDSLAAATDRPAVKESTAPADVKLAADINRAISESNLTQARWGVFVMSLRDGRVLYSRNGTELFTPASNMKVFTTAIAFDLLGGDYRWRTSVYAEKRAVTYGSRRSTLSTRRTRSARKYRR
jgi:D-alanyl-D-alanine carboxypeptidase/D-alanyl-D-alanine-endopeptidase (penicillin-binding protein 4)